MARIFTEGFEGGDLLLWTNVTSPVTVSSAQKKTGTYALRSDANANNTATRLLPSSYVEFFWKSWIYFDVTFNTDFMRFGTASNANIISIARSSSLLTVSANGVLKATAAAPVFSLNTWYLIELHAKIDGSVGILDAKVDGIQRITFSGATNAGGSDINRLSFSFGGGQGNMYWDDMAFNDTSGGADNSWCGDSRVIAINPNATGTYTNWLPSGSAVGYQCVDEAPPNSDTDFVYASATGTSDIYNLSNTALGNVIIYRVWEETVAKNSVADGSMLRQRIRSNNTDYVDGTGFALTASYARYLSSIWTVNPTSSGAWTTTELNDLQAGQEVV